MSKKPRVPRQSIGNQIPSAGKHKSVLQLNYGATNKPDEVAITKCKNS